MKSEDMKPGMEGLPRGLCSLARHAEFLRVKSAVTFLMHKMRAVAESRAHHREHRTVMSLVVSQLS